MQIETQSTKLIKPSFPTPPTLRHYKLGFIDEFVANVYVGVVLFFPAAAGQTHMNSNVVVDRLEQSLRQTLTRFYPLAGRYAEQIQTIDCNDQGARFVSTKTNIKLEDLLVSEENIKLIDDLFPSKTGSDDDWLLAIQVTIFDCGGVALAVTGSHKLVDVSTLSTVMKEWAAINRSQENDQSEIFTGTGFNSHLLFPARGLLSVPLPPPNINDALLKWTRKKLWFSEKSISNMKTIANRRWSKVQLVSAIIWKAFIFADQATDTYNELKESRLIQAVNLREKMKLLIPKDSCGNIWGFCATDLDFCHKKSDVDVTTEELVDHVSDSVKNMISKLSKLDHHSEEGQAMIFDSLLKLTMTSGSDNLMLISSWCKFPFYEIDFGLGKPIWVAPRTVPGDHIAYLMDDAQGGGVEAYVCLQVKHVPYFEQGLEHVNKAFGA